ncbi:MAG: hypothetical protein AAF078_01910 [Planctomycetota bacterium]
MPGPNDIRAGGAVVELSTRDEALQRGIRDAERTLRGFSRNVTQIGAAITAAAAVPAAALGQSLRTFNTIGDELDKAAQRTGVSVESLSEFGFAARQNDADLQQFVASVLGMQKVLRNAERGLSRAIDNLGALGIAYEDIKDLAPEDQFLLIFDRLAAIEDPTRRGALATQVLGGSAKALLPLLNQGSDGLARLRSEARQTGLVISTETAAGAALLGDTLQKVNEQTNRAQVSVGAAIAPDVTALLDGLRDVTDGLADVVDDSPEAIRLVAGLTASALAAGTSLLALGGGLRIAAFALAPLSTGLTTLTAGAVLPLIAVLAGAAGLVALIAAVAAEMNGGRLAGFEYSEALRQVGVALGLLSDRYDRATQAAAGFAQASLNAQDARRAFDTAETPAAQSAAAPSAIESLEQQIEARRALIRDLEITGEQEREIERRANRERIALREEFTRDENSDTNFLGERLPTRNGENLAEFTERRREELRDELRDQRVATDPVLNELERRLADLEREVEQVNADAEQLERDREFQAALSGGAELVFGNDTDSPAPDINALVEAQRQRTRDLQDFFSSLSSFGASPEEQVRLQVEREVRDQIRRADDLGILSPERRDDIEDRGARVLEERLSAIAETADAQITAVTRSLEARVNTLGQFGGAFADLASRGLADQQREDVAQIREEVADVRDLLQQILDAGGPIAG